MANFGNERRWELYDPALVNTGKIEFKRIWGNRPLEDDWRRSGKQTRALSGNTSINDSASVVADSPVASVLTKGTEAWNTIHADLKKNIPLSDTAFAQSQKRK